MEIRKLLLFLFICASLIISAVFSLKSFTGYLVSDIPSNGSNLVSFIFLVFGLFGTWIYIRNFRQK